ncbi:MAG: hypothetical protein JWN76_724 [Chitinophagaceae bacterium]|nr:hypothetical protein [Chitinophagaceae bacterium]
MRKESIILFFSIISALQSYSQKSFPDTAETYFREIKIQTSKHSGLWNKDIYGPILLVDVTTREVFANFPDSAGYLVKQGEIYTGTLPVNINLANTAVNWGGRKWAMMMLPLPTEKMNRISLMSHELFHRAQPELGFVLYNVNNNHLDTKDGRIFLKLELEALKSALKAKTTDERQLHLLNAVSFRKYRNNLFKGSGNEENLLELNEGIAEFTAVSIACNSDNVKINYLLNAIDVFYTKSTFIRSFAYVTTPVYGYFLSKKNKDWNKTLSVKDNLTELFIRDYHLQTITNAADITKTAAYYNGESIAAAEQEREEKTNALVTKYLKQFVQDPHTEITLENMNVSFNPGNLMPLEDKGTYYPNMRIVDNWGILTVTNGSVMAPGWNKINLSLPNSIQEDIVKGDGWSIELKPGWKILRDDTTRNYTIQKN